MKFISDVGTYSDYISSWNSNSRRCIIAVQLDNHYIMGSYISDNRSVGVLIQEGQINKKHSVSLIVQVRQHILYEYNILQILKLKSNLHVPWLSMVSRL